MEHWEGTWALTQFGCDGGWSAGVQTPRSWVDGCNVAQIRLLYILELRNGRGHMGVDVIDVSYMFQNEGLLTGACWVDGVGMAWDVASYARVQ